VKELFSGRGCRFSILLTVFLLGLLPARKPFVQAAEPNDISTGRTPQQKSSGGYCGIYCLYAAMRFLGLEADSNELIDPIYIGSVRGSSLAELKKAAESHGLYATPVARLSIKDLRQLSLPVIIHTKSSPTARTYDHYELFLGRSREKALIYDPPSPPESVEFWTLAPRWDGTGLLVSNNPIHFSAVFAPARRRFILYAAIVTAIVLAIRWTRRRFLSSRKVASRKRALFLSFGWCSALVVVATLASLTFHSFSDNGMLLRRQATDFIQQAYRAAFIPKISTGKVRRLLADHRAVFVDPRPDYAFSTGHLKDAVNIPPYLTDDQWNKSTDRIDKKARIIVYCRDTDCRLAGIVASRLASDGFSGVLIYKGKWHQWTQNSK